MLLDERSSMTSQCDHNRSARQRARHFSCRVDLHSSSRDQRSPFWNTPMRRLSLTRRRFLKGSAAFTVTSPFIVTHAYAEWPDRPIRFIVPFGPGGPVDVTARILQG